MHTTPSSLSEHPTVKTVRARPAAGKPQMAHCVQTMLSIVTQIVNEREKTDLADEYDAGRVMEGSNRAGPSRAIPIPNLEQNSLSISVWVERL
jgi:hypothetical protein